MPRDTLSHDMVDRHLKIVEPEDTVGTAIRDFTAGEVIEIDDTAQPIELREDVPFGHKIAIEPMVEDETVYKYGKSIGYASQEIPVGAWVHAHNVDSNYGRGDLATDTEPNND